MTQIYTQPPAKCDSLVAIQNVAAALSKPTHYTTVERAVLPEKKAYFLASVWLRDVYSPEGVSGSTWIGVSDERIYVHASGSWRNFYHHDIFAAVLVVPVQPGEVGDGDGKSLFIRVKLVFEGYVDATPLRLAMFSLSEVANDQAEDVSLLKEILQQRAVVTAMNPTPPDIEI